MCKDVHVRGLQHLVSTPICYSNRKTGESERKRERREEGEREREKERESARRLDIT